ncbi:hypothetical protein EVAR_99523_1 [Eumeta japonica]|uniref:Uncharacterized protein n=1 Tax=Eumeta variegata TaxID=151549 RepID=A0A4C1SGB8_EUMVA|nr:hypothetical protein EVAR_99523_1 [Eumeta japonica]
MQKAQCGDTADALTNYRLRAAGGARAVCVAGALSYTKSTFIPSNIQHRALCAYPSYRRRSVVTRPTRSRTTVSEPPAGPARRRSVVTRPTRSRTTVSEPPAGPARFVWPGL